MDIELEQLTAAIHDDELDFDFGNDDTLIVPEDDDLAIDSFFNASSDHEDDTDEILSLRSFQFGDDDFDGEFGDDLSDYSFSSSEESIDGSWDDEWRGRKKKRGQKYKRERKKQHAVEGRVCAGEKGLLCIIYLINPDSSLFHRQRDRAQAKSQHHPDNRKRSHQRDRRTAFRFTTRRNQTRPRIARLQHPFTPRPQSKPGFVSLAYATFQSRN